MAKLNEVIKGGGDRKIDYGQQIDTPNVNIDLPDISGTKSIPSPNVDTQRPNQIQNPTPVASPAVQEALTVAERSNPAEQAQEQRASSFARPSSLVSEQQQRPATQAGSSQSAPVDAVIGVRGNEPAIGGEEIDGMTSAQVDTENKNELANDRSRMINTSRRLSATTAPLPVGQAYTPIERKRAAAASVQSSAEKAAAPASDIETAKDNVKPDKPQVRVSRESAPMQNMPKRFIQSASKRAKNLKHSFGVRGKAKGNTISGVLSSNANVGINEASIGSINMMEAFRQRNSVVNKWVKAYLNENGLTDQYLQGNVILDEDAFQDMLVEAFRDGRVAQLTKTPIEEGAIHSVIVKVHRGDGIIMHPIVAPIFNADNDGDEATVSFNKATAFTLYRGNDDAVPGKMNTDLITSTDGKFKLDPDFWHQNPWGTDIDDVKGTIILVLKSAGIRNPVSVKAIAAHVDALAKDPGSKEHLEGIMRGLNANAIHQAKGNERVRAELAANLVKEFYNFNSFSPDASKAMLDVVLGTDEIFKKAGIRDPHAFEEDFVAIPLERGTMPANYYDILEARGMYAGFAGGNTYFRMFGGLAKTMNKDKRTVIQSDDPELNEAMQWIANNCRDATHDEIFSLMLKDQTSQGISFSKTRLRRDNVLLTVGLPTRYESFEAWRDAFIARYELCDKQAEISLMTKYINGKFEKNYVAKPLRDRNGKIDKDALRDAFVTTYGNCTLVQLLGDDGFADFVYNLDNTKPMPAGWQYMTINELINNSWWTSEAEGVVYTRLYSYIGAVMEKHTGDMRNFNNFFNKVCEDFRKSKNPNLAQATVLLSEDVFMSYDIQTEETFRKTWIGKAIESGVDIKNIVYTATADVLTVKLRDAFSAKDSIAYKAELEYLKGLSPVWKVLAMDLEDGNKTWTKFKPEGSGHASAINYVLDLKVSVADKEELIGKLVEASGLVPTNKWSNDFVAYNLMVKPGSDAVYKTDADYMQKNWREATNELKREPKRREVSHETAVNLAKQVRANISDYLSGKANPFTRISYSLVADAIVALGEGRYSLSEKNNQLAVVDALYSSLSQRELGGIYSDLSIFANKGTIPLEQALKSPELMSRLMFEDGFDPIVYDEYGRTVEIKKYDLNDLPAMIEANPAIADFFGAHEFVPKVNDGKEGDPQRVRTVIKDVDGQTPISRPYRDFERYTDHPSFYFLAAAFSGSTAGKTAAQQRRDTVVGIKKATEFVKAVQSGHISKTTAINRLIAAIPAEVASGVWVAPNGDEYVVATEMKTMFDKLFVLDSEIVWPDGARTPTVSKMDSQSVYKAFNVMQAMSSAKTNVSTGVNGDETRRYAPLAFLGNYVAPGGAGEAMEVPRTRNWESVSEYRGWVEQNTGLTVREDTLPEINAQLMEAGIASMRFFDPSENANAIGPDAAHAVGDNSFTVKTNQQSTALGRLMTTLRALGTEAFNLKVKKAGDDGKDTIIKFDKAKVFGAVDDCKFLRSLEGMDLVSARKAYAEFLEKQFHDPAYVSDYDMFTKGDFANLASWCVAADVNGNVHFRSIGQLNAAVTNYLWQYRQLTDGKQDHPSIQAYLIDRLVNDPYETVTYDFLQDIRSAPAGEAYDAMVSFRDSSSPRRELTAARFLRENPDTPYDLIGDGYIETDPRNIELAKKRGNVFVGDAAKKYPGAFQRYDGKWEVDFFTTRMNQLNLPDPQSRFSAGEFSYLPSEVKCIQLDNTGIEQLADAAGVATQYERDNAMFTFSGSEEIRITDLFSGFIGKHVKGSDSPRVSLLSREEINDLFLYKQGPIVWDPSVYGVSQTRDAIDEFALQIESNNFVDGDHSAFISETHPGRVIGVAKMEVGVGDGKRVCYAPVMAFDTAKGGNAPYFLTVDNLAIDRRNGSINIDWSFNGTIHDGSAKFLQDMAAFNKMMTSREPLALDPDRRDAAGTPINFIVNQASVMSRMKGMLQNHCMNSTMWFARSRIGYNFAEVEGAFPDNPEFKEKVRSGLATKDDWRKALDDGIAFHSDMDDKDRVSINTFCKGIVEKSLMYHVNPEWFFVSDINGKELCYGTDWMIYTNASPAMKDAWFHFFHTLNPKFCPDKPGVETDESSYYWDSDWKFEAKHPYIDARTGQKMVATAREYHFYARHSYDDHYTGFKTPGRTKPKTSSLTGEITKMWSGKIPDEKTIDGILEYRFGKQNPLFGMDDVSYGLEIVSDTSELAEPKKKEATAEASMAADSNVGVKGSTIESPTEAPATTASAMFRQLTDQSKRDKEAEEAGKEVAEESKPATVSIPDASSLFRQMTDQSKKEKEAEESAQALSFGETLAFEEVSVPQEVSPEIQSEASQEQEAAVDIVEEVPTEGSKEKTPSMFRQMVNESKKEKEAEIKAVTAPIVDKAITAREDYTATDIADSATANAHKDLNDAAAIAGTDSAAFKQAVDNAKKVVEATSGKTTRESDVADLQHDIDTFELKKPDVPEDLKFLEETESEQLRRAHNTINSIKKMFADGRAYNYSTLDARHNYVRPKPSDLKDASYAEIRDREQVDAAEDALIDWLMAGSSYYGNLTAGEKQDFKREVIEQLLMCYYSYSVDSNGYILGSEGEVAWSATPGKGESFDIPDRDRLRACQDMLSNFKRYGYFSRCEMVKNSRMTCFGLERVSIPIPSSLAEKIFNANLQSRWESIEEFNTEGQLMWGEYCEYMSQNPDVWFAGEEGTDAIGRAWGPYMMNAALNGATDEELVSMGLVAIEPFIDWYADKIGVGEDGREASEAVKKNVSEARRRFLKENGAVSDTVNLRDVRNAAQRANKFEGKLLKRMAKFVQINKMLGITVWLPATAESSLGSGSEALLTDMMYRQAGADRLSKDFYKTLDGDKNFIAAISMMVDAMNAGTWDELVDRANSKGLGAYDMSLKGYVEDTKARNNGKGGATARIDYALNKGGNVAVHLASGSSVAKNFNAHRVMDMMYLWMRQEAIANGGNLTVEDFQKQVLANPEKFATGLAQTAMGREAVLFAAQSIVGGANVVNYRWNKLMAKYPIVDACLTLFVHTFHRYGIAMAQAVVPYSHTIQYLMAQRHKGDASDGASNYAYSYVTMSQMIAYDSILLGFKAAPLLIVTGLFMAMGIEPPDDDDKLNIYGEWKIGGVPLSDSWMFRDLFGFISPLVVAAYGAAHGADFRKLLLDGAAGVIQGLPWEDLSTVVSYIANFDSDLLMNEDELDDAWDIQKGSPEYWMSKASATALRTVGKWFDNPVVSSFYRGTFIPGQTELAHSASQVYAYDEEGKLTTTRTDWADAQMRKVTRSSYSAALMMNAAALISGAAGGTPNKPFTGYLNGDMPLITVIDPAQAALADYLDIKVGMTEEEQREKVLQSLSILDSFKSAEEAAQNGFVLPYATRQMMYEYLMDQVDYLQTDFGNRKAAGEFYGDYAAQNEAYKLMKARVNWCYEMKERIYGNAIPYSPTKYNQWVTNYNAYYTNKETGEPASWWDYMLDDDGIEKHLYAVGDHKSANAPLNIVDTRYGTYDQQTPVGWQGDLTDIEKVRKLYEDVTISGGWHDGEKAMDLLTGYGNSMDKLLMGDRSFIPVGQEYDAFKLTDPKDLKNAWHPFTDGTIGISPETGEIVGGDGTKQVDESGDGNGGSTYPRGTSEGTGYPRSSGGGGYSRGGGGSSSPNIYSRASSGGVNAPRAATMYSKTPSYTRFSYLSPRFETKGSREAYKRQDI